MNLKLAGKVNLAMAILVIVALVVGIMGITALRSYQQVVDQMAVASRRGLLAERVNGLVLAVVMDSRGIYMAGSPQEREKFAVPLLKNLERLTGALDQWRAQVPPANRPRFAKVEAAATNFVRFRTELVRLAREASIAEARVYGDNDANRSSRMALNDALGGAVAVLETEVAGLDSRSDEEYDRDINLLIGLLGAGLIAGIGAAVLVVSRQITGPLGRITATMQALAGGDYEVAIPHAGRRDEIGAMAAAVRVFKDNAQDAERLRRAQEQERALAERDKLAALRVMAETVEREAGIAVDRVASQTERMSGNASEMAGLAASVGAHSQSVATAAAQAQANAQSVAAASDQLSASIEEIGRQVSAAGAVTDNAVGAAQGAQDTIGRLAISVGRIGDFARLISDIASQTNLLALNATKFRSIKQRQFA